MLGQLCREVIANADRDGRNAEWEVLAIQSDIALELKLTKRVVTRLMNTGYTLVTRLQATLDRWEHGGITRHQVDVIVHAVIGLDADEAEALERALLEVAETGTPADLRRAALAFREQVKSESLLARHNVARASRCVTLTPAEDGMAWLAALLPGVDAAAAFDRTRHIALDIRSSGDLTATATDASSAPEERQVLGWPLGSPDLRAAARGGGRSERRTSESRWRHPDRS